MYNLFIFHSLATKIIKIHTVEVIHKMFTKKKKTILLSAVALSTWSGMAMAAKNVTLSSTVSGWPLPIFLAGLIVFRKKIFHGHDIPSLESVDKPESKPKNEPKKKETVKAKAKEAVKTNPKTKPVKKKAETKKTAAIKKTTVSKTENKVVDLTEGSKQCQASTSKGARCKRTNTLENATLVLDDTTYTVVVCAQHNTNKLKIYSKLIN